MKTINLFIALLMMINFSAKAQFVTIPDANFVNYLQTYIPSCMNGNLMDTTCADITNETYLFLNGLNISDLTGVQYFTSLYDLSCRNNQLTSLPSLPANLSTLDCQENQLTSLPSLPANLEFLYCLNNLLTNLPSLPNNLQTLYCDNNLLTSLPTFPGTLQYLSCGNNQLTSLPSFPANLIDLYCEDNLLTSLPSLPNNLQTLFCSYNNISSLTNLPSLPANLMTLYCNNNNISCFPIFPISLNNGAGFSIGSNPFSCLPNYIDVMDAAILAYPLCLSGDTSFNNSGCANAEGIVGYLYKDNNSNCLKDNGDLSINNIPVNLYDNNNNLLTQTYSFSNGVYNFVASSETYKVEIDTTDMPFTVQCAYPGNDTTVVLSGTNLLASDVNFSIACNSGFDIGVQSVVPSGWVFPGQQHKLRIFAGDMSSWYNLNCAAGVNGQVTVTVTGSVSYDGIVDGALTPTVSGNVFTYDIVDFGTLNIQQAFGLLFSADTTAQAGDEICVNIAVASVGTDNNPSNNNYQFCYLVINSYDPNMKEVYPVNVAPGFQDWFTYSIHFQNTGTAPAFNILLRDTLSPHLDLETFQVINYSHQNTVSLTNNLLTFRFPTIMLPDSTTNLEGSKGFVQYRIKPKSNLPLGTQIKNTAYIYFDYNYPIITNTTTSEFTNTASVNSVLTDQESQLLVYPNPGNGNYLVKSPKNVDGQLLNIEVYNSFGELVLSINTKDNITPINIRNQPDGIYFVKVNVLDKWFGKSIIKQ